MNASPKFSQPQSNDSGFETTPKNATVEPSEHGPLESGTAWNLLRESIVADATHTAGQYLDALNTRQQGE